MSLNENVIKNSKTTPTKVELTRLFEGILRNTAQKYFKTKAITKEIFETKKKKFVKSLKKFQLL